jgi:hypothetical protein
MTAAPLNFDLLCKVPGGEVVKIGSYEAPTYFDMFTGLAVYFSTKHYQEQRWVWRKALDSLNLYSETIGRVRDLDKRPVTESFKVERPGVSFEMVRREATETPSDLVN